MERQGREEREGEREGSREGGRRLTGQPTRRTKDRSPANDGKMNSKSKNRAPKSTLVPRGHSPKSN